MKKKRVLVTTDLSENSYKVVNKAMGYALARDMWLEVLHVVEPSLFAFGFPSKDDENRQATYQKEKLIEFSDNIKTKMNHVMEKMNVEVRLGEISDVVASYIKEKSIDLIIIGGSERDGGVKELVLGSTAKRIIAKADIPVLVSKSGNEISYKKIFVPTDFSDLSLASIELLASARPDAEFVLWHTVDVPTDIQLAFYKLEQSDMACLSTSAKAVASENMKNFIEKIRSSGGPCKDLNIKSEIETGHINGEIVVYYAKKIGADLICLATNTALFSNTFVIVEKSDVDVMLYRSK